MGGSFSRRERVDVGEVFLGEGGTASNGSFGCEDKETCILPMDIADSGEGEPAYGLIRVVALLSSLVEWMHEFSKKWR